MSWPRIFCGSSLFPFVEHYLKKMLTVIYNLINRILTIRNRRLVLKSAVFRGKAQILRRAHIRLLCDSVPDDIEIGDNFRFLEVASPLRITER